MSVPFEIPDWLVDNTSPAPAAPDTADVDPHRVEDLVNRFIAGKQEALFTAPDAYYRTTGADAVDGAPAILDRLDRLREATLKAAGDDGTHFHLGPRLDAHLDDASDGIDRHVTAQRDVQTRQIISERQRLIQRAAQFEHNNDDKLAGLAEAHASAAQELARMNGEPEAAAMDAARSAIWHAAINHRLANGNGSQALALFDRVNNRLTSTDRQSLDTPLQVARTNQTADQWIASQTGTEGPPMQDRAAVDPTLSPDTQLVVRAKLDARDSAAESKRVAAVKGLDDQIADTTRILASTPGAYKPGTLAGIAGAYDDAGEPGKAAATRRIAIQEAVLIPFAQASADKQQRQIDSLPEGEARDAAIAIQRQQAAAFARDALAAGTTLYPEVGSPTPIDDIQGRIRQARQIAELRGISVAPFTVDEIRGMQRRLTERPQESDPAGATVDSLPQERVDAIGLQPATEVAEQGIASPDTQTAQSVWPFLAKPPSAPPPSRPAIRYKEPIPGLSGKQKADDIPSRFRGMRPRVGESGNQAAERIFDEAYGNGKWSLRNPETRRDFNRLKKYFDRGFRDPQALPGPKNRIPGEEFGV